MQGCQQFAVTCPYEMWPSPLDLFPYTEGWRRETGTAGDKDVGFCYLAHNWYNQLVSGAAPPSSRHNTTLHPTCISSKHVTVAEPTLFFSGLIKPVLLSLHMSVIKGDV